MLPYYGSTCPISYNRGSIFVLVLRICFAYTDIKRYYEIIRLNIYFLYIFAAE